MIVNHNPALSFDDVLLVPRCSTVSSRKDINIASDLFEGIRLRVPIISAPMSCVTESDMAIAMAQAGGIGIIHRFMEPEKEVVEYKKVDESGHLAICAIGINEGYERYEMLMDAGCDMFCVDVAHAHSLAVEKWFEGASRTSDNYMMVGNIATAHAAEFLLDLPIDSVKVGIGPGAVCSTREVTGYGVPQLTAIIEVASVMNGAVVTVVADGGIRNSGDIVKALAAGADTVMIGRLLAGADESPFPGVYFGMASKKMNGHHAPEGVEGSVPLTGPVADTLKQLAWGIRSGVSYGGSKSLKWLREDAEFRVVTAQSLAESSTRI